MTYEDLLARTSSLAADIQSSVHEGSLIAIEVMSPAAAAICILAAARAGCAVLPLNHDSPPLHRRFVLEDARPALLMKESLGGLLRIEPAPGTRDGDIMPRRDMHGVAYVMYTSGSTGRPKGVVVSDEALLARLEGLSRLPGFTRDDSIIAMTALSFDISLAEILLPLSAGGRFISAPWAARLDPETFAATVAMYTPTVIQATPSFWRLALAWGWEGEPESRIWCGGEPLTTAVARGLLPRCRELWNLYGPTEATIWASAALIRRAETISLGDALPGVRICLEGSDGELIREPSVPGEILLYGAGLADGYLDQTALTKERFAVRETPDGCVRCYRTGDAAQYDASGTAVFLGRNDGQVKLRGHRVELGEIENLLEEHSSVYQAVAVVKDPDQPERTCIAAFVVTDGGVTVKDLRRWIADRLPDAMRPRQIRIVPGIPRTVAGKADRVQLARYDGG
jgi:D-alanine--poly(phosphoribitol) ligase subunit 1